MAMIGKKAKRVLFWINGSKPTDEHIAEAELIDGQVMFRNALHVPHEGAMEPFDLLAGPAVPERYQKEFEAREAKPVEAAKNAVEIKQQPDANEGSNIDVPKKGAKSTKWAASPPVQAQA